MSNSQPSPSLFRRYRWVIVGLLIAAAVVVFLAPQASPDPDGLDRVAEDKGFIEEGREPRFEFLPDYSIPGIDNENLSTVLSVLVGVAIVFGIVMAFGLAARARKGQSDGPGPLPRT